MNCGGQAGEFEGEFEENERIVRELGIRDRGGEESSYSFEDGGTEEQPKHISCPPEPLLAFIQNPVPTPSPSWGGGFDEYMNLVLDDAEEVNVKKKSKKTLGRILLKGDNITLMMNTGK
uniref:Small nuclear ribonucleoprotein E n=1 Tax=Fagus sylvatica TaxID=28930 RepID=A0A2N9IK25_FAGSY